MTVDLVVGVVNVSPNDTHTQLDPLAQPYIGGAKGTAVGTIDASTGGPPTTLKCTPNRAQNPSPESNSAALSAHEFWSRLGGTGAKLKLAQSMQVCHYTNALCTWSVICILLCAFSLNKFHSTLSRGAPLSRVRLSTHACGHQAATRSSPPPYPPCVTLPCETPTCRYRANQESRQQST